MTFTSLFRKTQVISFGMAHPEIVDGRIVEAFFASGSDGPWDPPKASVIPEDLFGAAVILHNDDLVIL